jgi:mono/diheme cytochrome c family protein
MIKPLRDMSVPASISAMPASPRFWFAVFAWVLVVAPGRTADPTLAATARVVLKTHCGRCHGTDSPGKGGFNFVLDRERLVARNKVVPGDADRSALYQRMAEGEMPPAEVKNRPTSGDIVAVRQWIAAGAPVESGVTAPLMSEADAVYLIVGDLKKIPTRQRRFMRYFTLANLSNAGSSQATLQSHRHAVSKLINSLSWHPRITAPQSIDPGANVLRIDLRDYQWNAVQWNRMAAVYPYLIPQRSTEFKALTKAVGSDLPYVRADWFVATASRPPLYYDLLQIPSTDRELERRLRVDVTLDIREERVARSGFNGSGVARNNRLLERHDAAYGAYWRSYDFGDNSERQNIFAHPLGPNAEGNSFQHSGGEIIFNLPNGLQAYMLVDANGRRLDRAPVEIVSDPQRPDRAVEAGVSCMSCHVQGIIHKADQIRAHVAKNANVFSKADMEIVEAIYPPEDRFKTLVEEDAKRFRTALAKTGTELQEREPIATLTLRYEGEMDLRTAAADVGLQPAEFLKRLGTSTSFGRALGALKVPGGTIQRSVFQEAFPDLVRELKLGDEISSSHNQDPLRVSSTPRPFEGHTEHILAIAISPEGRRVLSGSEDESLRLWDLATGREIRRLHGHTGAVLAVAFAPDGRRAVSGGRDGTVRLWDIDTGRELRRFGGHTERVSSVAFSPDGCRGLSASRDRTIYLWDMESGKALRRLDGHAGAVSSVAFSADGSHALSGSYDRTVRLWDLKSGKEIRCFNGAIKEVYCVAFSPDGSQVAAGGNDHVVRLWDANTGKERQQFNGHNKAVIAVAFSPDGNRLLSGSSQYEGSDKVIRLWDITSGQEMPGLEGMTDTVWSIAFARDGRFAVSGTADKTLRLWELSK